MKFKIAGIAGAHQSLTEGIDKYLLIESLIKMKLNCSFCKNTELKLRVPLIDGNVV